MGLRLRLNLLLSLIFFATLAIGAAILINVLRNGVTEELSASVDQTAKLITVVRNPGSLRIWVTRNFKSLSMKSPR